MKHVFLLGFFLGSAALAQDPGDIPETYVVQPGDTCMGIAKKFFGSASEYSRVHKLNDLGPLPHKLKPGTLIQLREATKDTPTLQSDARLTAFSAAVNIRGAKMSAWKPAEPNQPLFRLDEVHTLSRASASILFKDFSTLQMKQSALVIIYGGTSSKARLQQAAGIQLVEGELGVSLANLRKPPATIVTPSAEISVRASEAIVDVDAQQTSRVSVQSGEAKITAKGKSVSLKSGQGIRVKKGAAPEAPMPLPQPPAWEDSEPHELHVVYGARKTTTRLQWTKPPSLGSGRYRVEVAEDVQFQNLALEKTMDERHWLFAELGPGTFYVRVRAINEAGLISAPSPTKRLDILKVGDDHSAASETTDAAHKVTGQVPFTVSEELPEDIHVFVNGKRMSPPWVIQEPGVHLVEFRTRDGELSVRTEVEALPPRFTLEEGIGPEGKPELQLRFETAIPPEAKLQVRGQDGTLVGPLIREDGKTFKAPVSDAHSYHVHVLWGNYPLGHLQKDRPPPASQEKGEKIAPSREKPAVSPPPYVQPLSILRERQLGNLALPTAYLPQSFQLNAALDIGFSKEKAMANMAQLGARIDGPFKRGSYFANLALVNYARPNDSLVYPELAAGIHMQFPIRKQWTAGFATDLSASIKTHRPQREPFLRLRTMGVLGYQTEVFSVSTTQGIAGAYANSLHAAWIGSISASWHIWPNFLLAAQWDGQKTADKSFASAAATGFRLLVGPVEVGVTGHVGLTSEGRSQWGDYGVSLTFGIR